MKTEVATVPVISAWYSKINITQVVAATAMLTTFFGGDKFSLDANQQAALVVTIGVAAQFITVLWRTFFNASVNPSSLPQDIKITTKKEAKNGS